MAFKDFFVPYPDTPAEIAKAIVYMFLGGAGALMPALADNIITPIETIQALIIFVGLIPVYIIGSNVGKTVSVAVIAGLQVLANIISESGNWSDINMTAWLTVIITAFAAIGVAVTPNKSPGAAPVEVTNVSTVVVPNAEVTEDEIAANVSAVLRDDYPLH
jgi:hypothetical protein